MNSLFELELKRLINSHSIENGSNTPDFMLARYLMNCLENWESIIEDRDRWHKKEPTPGNVPTAKAVQLVASGFAAIGCSQVNGGRRCVLAKGHHGMCDFSS